jgi:hypothetical protein
VPQVSKARPGAPFFVFLCVFLILIFVQKPYDRRPAGIGGDSANQVGKTCALSALSALSRSIWLSPGQSSDKRDDVFVYALRTGERPVCHPSPLSGLGPMTGGAVFSRLSRLLNQENALSVPCLQHFRNYCGPIKVARCGFPWEKTTERPVASVCTNCETAYAVTPALRRPRRRF